MMNTKRERMKDDAKVIRGKMCKYGDANGAHLGFIVEENVGKEFVIGGRSDLLGGGIAEVMATLAFNGFGKEFIDAVYGAAKTMYGEMENKKGTRTLQ